MRKPIHHVIMLAIVAFVGTASAQPCMPPAPPAEKTYTLAFDKTPWPEVFKWFEKESGLTYIDAEKPEGTFTHKADRKYTLPQVLDLLNEALAEKKKVIYRRSQTFLVIPSDERNTELQASMITVDELPSRGDTEVVQVILPIRIEITEGISKEIKKRLGKHGTASAFGSDQLIILDTAKNIRIILAYIRTVEDSIQPGCALLKYRCKSVRPSKAIEQLQALHVDPKPAKPETEKSAPREWGGKATAPKTGRIGVVTYSIDDGEITLKGPIKDVAKWFGILQVFDKGDVTGKETWKTYPVTAGTA